jgi:hypothetical protein
LTNWGSSPPVQDTRLLRATVRTRGVLERALEHRLGGPPSWAALVSQARFTAADPWRARPAADWHLATLPLPGVPQAGQIGGLVRQDHPFFHGLPLVLAPRCWCGPSGACDGGTGSCLACGRRAFEASTAPPNPGWIRHPLSANPRAAQRLPCCRLAALPVLMCRVSAGFRDGRLRRKQPRGAWNPGQLPHHSRSCLKVKFQGGAVRRVSEARAPAFGHRGHSVAGSDRPQSVWSRPKTQTNQPSRKAVRLNRVSAPTL